MKSIKYGLLPLMVSLAVSCGKEPEEKGDDTPVTLTEFLLADYDKDGNGLLDDQEVLAIERIDCIYQGITSLEGIERLANLRYLDCRGNALKEVDFSKNPRLEYLDCRSNMIESLDVSSNAALESLDCSLNPLDKVEIRNHAALRTFSCRYNELDAVDLSGCTALEEIFLDASVINELDMSGCTALTSLDCIGKQLTALDVSGCTALTGLSCYRNQLTSLDVSGCTALTSLECYENQLTSIDLSKNTKLEYLNCDDNQLTSIDLSKNTKLEYLNCDDNEYYVTAANNRFDLSLLPGDFDVAKASDWSGGTVEGNILTFTGDETNHERQVCASYAYQTGYTGEEEDCKTVWFTLVCDNYDESLK